MDWTEDPYLTDKFKEYAKYRYADDTKAIQTLASIYSYIMNRILEE